MSSGLHSLVSLLESEGRPTLWYKLCKDSWLRQWTRLQTIKCALEMKKEQSNWKGKSKHAHHLWDLSILNLAKVVCPEVDNFNFVGSDDVEVR